MNNLVVRAITGALFVAVILGSILYSHHTATCVFAIFALLGIIEFYKLFDSNDIVKVDWRIGTLFFLLIYGIVAGVVYLSLPFISLVFIIPLLFLLMLTELWQKQKHPLINASILVVGIFYLGTPFLLATAMNFSQTAPITFGLSNEDVAMYESYIQHMPWRMPSIALMFILIWTNDTFAYLSGRMLGKTKMFERISPNKTWEGTIGGIVMTLLVAFVLSIYTPVYGDVTFWLIAAAIISTCAILGDLFESMIKRSLNIKDSGTLLPGHGGILDRFDAMLYTVPFFAAWTIIYPYI